MTTTDAKRRAARALEEVMTGRPVPEAVGIVAALEQVTGEQVISDVRRTRYLVVNAANPVTDLERNAPADVIVIRWRYDDESEPKQTALLAQLGVSGISCLPCVIAWEPARSEDDGEGGTMEVPAGYREVRVEDAQGASWLLGSPPADRLRSVRGWGLHATPPPFPGER